MKDDKFIYNPEVQYYFLSVCYVGSCPAWIRRPFLTKEEIDEFLIYEYTPNIDQFSDLHIYNESFLREIVEVKNTQDSSIEIDIRSWLFGEHYSSRCEYYENIINQKNGLRYKSSYAAWADKNKATAN